LGSENPKQKNFRVALSKKVAEVIANASGLLGMEVPNRM
jgi:arginyl-tRNA synthetase